MAVHGRYVEPTVSDDSYGTYLTSSASHRREYRHVKDRRFSSESNESNDYSKSGALQWSRYGIFFCNVVFMVVGTVILVMGAWLRTDSRFRDFLSERYRRVVHDAFWEAPTLYIFSYILIVLGACMILVALMGCCGVNANAKPFLIVYTIMVFILLVATLSSGIYILYKKDGIDMELNDALNYMVQHYYQGPGIVQESLDHLQQTFRCCGNAGCSDFRAFRQDPPRTCDIRCDGCNIRIWNALVIGFSAACVVFFFVILCQALAIVLAIFLIMRHESDVRVVYYRASKYEIPPQRLTRENLQRHNMPYSLRSTKYR